MDSQYTYDPFPSYDEFFTDYMRDYPDPFDPAANTGIDADDEMAGLAPPGASLSGQPYSLHMTSVTESRDSSWVEDGAEDEAEDSAEDGAEDGAEDDASTSEDQLDATLLPSVPSFGGALGGGPPHPSQAAMNPIVITAPHQGMVIPLTAAPVSTVVATTHLQVIAAPIIAAPPAVILPIIIYRTIGRTPPSPRRFASQSPAPHGIANPPPPAQNLATISNKLTNNGAQLVGKVPHEAQPPLMGRVMTMNEIMLFAPNWLRCPEVALCAIRNGYETSDLVQMFFAPNGPPTTAEKNIAAARIRKHMSDGARLLVLPGVNMTFGPHLTFDARTAKQDLGPQPDLTANEWELRAAYVPGCTRTTDFTHVTLAAFYGNGTLPIAAFPTGTAEGVLTKCLRFARSNPQLRLDTSHFDWIIQTQGF
ncbi:hypothetical protein LTR74_007697 [Friedmanniomyces endolithicus]|nr:hypothetical protein LTR74_007697 [Friedmanniomyces endolithicus]